MSRTGKLGAATHIERFNSRRYGKPPNVSGDLAIHEVHVLDTIRESNTAYVPPNTTILEVDNLHTIGELNNSSDVACGRKYKGNKKGESERRGSMCGY